THITPNLQNETDVLLENRFDGGGEVFFGKEVRNLLAVPLISDRRIIGVLLGLNKHDGDFDSFDAKLIGSIANQSSVFLANHHMYAELQDLLMGVLQSLTESIDAKDPYTCGHSRRVAEISHRLAIGCKFSPEEVQNIYLAGLLHDVGKIGVPEVILCKEGRLTDEEYDIMKRHPGIGAKILGQIRNFEPIISGVLSHHERLDGGGVSKRTAGSGYSHGGQDYRPGRQLGRHDQPANLPRRDVARGGCRRGQKMCRNAVRPHAGRYLPVLGPPNFNERTLCSQRPAALLISPNEALRYRRRRKTDRRETDSVRLTSCHNAASGRLAH
ncbi:MAG TPA: HD domain-containing protein, partial [Phycisphaerae bacterium]|nr:HD domain-containing protein [Phycisphaerae bacterium]